LVLLCVTPDHTSLDFGLLIEGLEKWKPSELQCWLRDHTHSGGFRDQA
jgi:hypothetical protein